MSYLTDEEKQQLTFDWRYRGFSTIQLLTEEECEEINTELEQLRTNRFYNKDTGNEWGEYDPFMYPHKLSDKLAKLFSHPKIIESCEFLMGGSVSGTQTWAYFKPPGQLGRDMHQNSFYTKCKHNEYVNVALALDNHDKENGAVWNLEGTHRLPILPIEVDDERAKTNPKTGQMREVNHVYYQLVMILKRLKDILVREKWFYFIHTQYMVQNQTNQIGSEETF